MLFKKALAALTITGMVLTMVPLSAFADDGETTVDGIETPVVVVDDSLTTTDTDTYAPSEDAESTDESSGAPVLEDIATDADDTALVDEIPVINSIESSRLNPAPLNSTQEISVQDFFGNYTAQITVNQIIRGNDAWAMIKKANMFNRAPKDGYEYILAKINFNLVDIADGKTLDVSPMNFNLISSDGKEYDYASVVVPDPKLRTSLYGGASNEGWAAYQVRVDDATPTLAYGRKYDGTGGIWFKAYND